MIHYLGAVVMDEFQKTFLRAAVSEYDKLLELEKQTGVETRVLARLLSPALGIDESSVDSPGYQGSEPFMKVLNMVRGLAEAGLLKELGNGPVYWVTPTGPGRELVETWDYEKRSSAFQGRRVVRYVYEVQGNLSPVDRQVGRAGQIDFDELCSDLGIDYDMYLRAVRWAVRQEYIAEPSVDQYTVENGGIYITDKGIDAVDNEFKTDQPVSGPTINIHDSQVYGNVLAAGRDAMVITSPALAENAEELRSLLAKIQAAAESLPEDGDERHDTLKELESIQREFSKETPLRGRIERSINVMGGLASISTMAGQHLTRLLELAQQLPGV